MSTDVDAGVNNLAGRVVMDLCAECCGVRRERVTRATTFVELDRADSLGTVELMLELEDRLDVRLSDEEVAGLRTVGGLVDLIEARASL